MKRTVVYLCALIPWAVPAVSLAQAGSVAAQAGKAKLTPKEEEQKRKAQQAKQPGSQKVTSATAGNAAKAKQPGAEQGSGIVKATA